VRIRQITDVHVIPHGRAVGGVVVVPKDFDCWTAPLRRGDDKRNEMRLGCVILAEFAIGIGTGCIKIAQTRVTKPIRPLVPMQDDF